jgi:hypothetical protein
MNRPTAATARQPTSGRSTKKIAGKAVSRKRSAAKRSGGERLEADVNHDKFTATDCDDKR